MPAFGSQVRSDTVVFSCNGREANLAQCRNFTLAQCLQAGVYCFGKMSHTSTMISIILCSYYIQVYSIMVLLLYQ